MGFACHRVAPQRLERPNESSQHKKHLFDVHHRSNTSHLQQRRAPHRRGAAGFPPSCNDPRTRPGPQRTATEAGSSKAIGGPKPADAASVSMGRDHPAHPERRRQTPFAVHVSVRPRRASAEDPPQPAAAASERGQDEAENRREKDNRDEGLYGTGQDPARPIRAAKPAENAAGLPGRQSSPSTPLLTPARRALSSRTTLYPVIR